MFPCWIIPKLEDCAALSNGMVEIVEFYTRMFKTGKGLVNVEEVTIRTDEIEYEAASVWYKLGLYDKYGHDYWGKSYVLGDGGVHSDTYWQADLDQLHFNLVCK